MKASIKQISEMTGFSPATVSNALNNKKGVNRETQEKILQAARECGYLSEGGPIHSIRFVIYKDSGRIVADTPFFSALIEGVEMESRRGDFETVICNLNRSAPDYEERLNQILTDPTSGILLLATELDEKEAARFKEALAPVVVLDNWFEETSFNSVLISNTDSSCAAAEYLIRRGHREIGYLQSEIPIKNFFYRIEGYERALKAHGLEPPEGGVLKLPPSMDGAREQMNRLLREGVKLPPAFLADNDIIALGAMKAMQDNGIRVPDDVSIIGFDDLPFCSITTPGLTTIRVFKQEMGRTAVRRLLELIRYGDQYVTKSQICTAFVERGSVRDCTPPVVDSEPEQPAKHA